MYRKCLCCNKNFKVKKIKKGYSTCKYCDDCRKKARVLAIQKTCLEKYGVISSLSLESTHKKSRQTKLKKYGNAYYCNSEKIKNTRLQHFGNPNYNNRELYKQTCLEKYGVDSTNKVEKIKKKGKVTKFNKYGNSNYNNRKQAKQTCLEKYGVEHYVQSEDFSTKQRETKVKNNTWAVSKDEKYLEKMLHKKFKDIKVQYKSEKYPFNCDFYIPELDLYIEYQGTWTHGKSYGPYNKDNPIHQKILIMWQEKSKLHPAYLDAIDVWTRRDPLKRETAVKNKLNWIEFFTIEDFMIWYKNNL